MASSICGVYSGSAGRLCLDFANTENMHASANPEETLHSYDDMIAWARKTGALPDAGARALILRAKENPALAQRALHKAIRVREAIYRIFAAIARKTEPNPSDLDELNQELSRITGGAKIAPLDGGFEWWWNLDRESLELPIAFAVLSAAETLVSSDRERIGQCADDRGCGWLFLDATKNHSRRWCDSTSCGNRERQQRHAERHRTAKDAPPR